MNRAVPLRALVREMGQDRLVSSLDEKRQLLLLEDRRASPIRLAHELPVNSDSCCRKTRSAQATWLKMPCQRSSRRAEVAGV